MLTPDRRCNGGGGLLRPRDWQRREFIPRLLSTSLLVLLPPTVPPSSPPSRLSLIQGGSSPSSSPRCSLGRPPRRCPCLSRCEVRTRVPSCVLRRVHRLYAGKRRRRPRLACRYPRQRLTSSALSCTTTRRAPINFSFSLPPSAAIRLVPTTVQFI